MPYTGMVLFIVSLVAGAFLILLGHWLVAAGMFPQATRSFAEVYDRRGIRATLVGIFTFGPLVLLVPFASQIPNRLVQFVIIVAGIVALLIALAGSAGLAWRIGRNLCPQASMWQQSQRGGTMLALVFITPFLGWFFLLPVGLASGFGAFLLAKPWKSIASAPRESTPAPIETPVAALS